MALRSITTQRRRLADEVYDQLVRAIMDREIGPEDRLVQEKLAAELDISRTPVREALLRLEKEGVLYLANSGGFRLAKISEEEVISVFMPTSPMPMTGYTVFVQKSRVIPLDMSVDEALRVTVSGGVILPPSEKITVDITNPPPAPLPKRTPQAP